MSKFKGPRPQMGGGMGGMNNIAKQVEKLQAEMERVQQESAEKTVEASSGGGAVKVVASGKKQLVSIAIDPAAVDQGDVETLQDLILIAANEALRMAEEQTNNAMGALTGGLNIPGLF